MPTRLRKVIVDAQKPVFEVRNRSPSKEEVCTKVEATLFQVRSNLIVIDNSNCAFCFLQFNLQDGDDDGTCVKNDPFPMDPTTGPQMVNDTNPVRLVFLPHGTYTVKEVCSMLNKLIERHTFRVHFRHDDSDFVHIDFKALHYHEFEFHEEFRFKYRQQTAPSTYVTHYVEPGNIFSIEKNSTTIKMTASEAHFSPEGTSSTFLGFLGFKPITQIGYDVYDIVTDFTTNFTSSYGQQSTTSLTTPFPFYVRIDEEIFEVIEVIDNLTLKTRNPAIETHSASPMHVRERAYNADHKGHSLTLEGEKIIIPMSSMVKDLCLRRFGTTFGSILDSLGFSQHQTRNLYLMGHLTKFEYFSLCEYGLEEAYYTNINGNRQNEANVSLEYKNSGRYPAMEKSVIVSRQNRDLQTNLSGHVEIYRSVPIQGHVNDTSNQGRITALRFFATDTPTYKKHSQGLHSYCLQFEGGDNLIELQSNPGLLAWENNYEKLVFPKSNSSFAKGIAVITQSELGERTMLSSHNGGYIPNILRFKIVNRKNQVVSQESLRVRVGLEFTYETKDKR